MKIGSENEVPGENVSQCHFVLKKSRINPTWYRTQAESERSRRLTTWGSAPPQPCSVKNTQVQKGPISRFPGVSLWLFLGVRTFWMWTVLTTFHMFCPSAPLTRTYMNHSPNSVSQPTSRQYVSHLAGRLKSPQYSYPFPKATASGSVLERTPRRDVCLCVENSFSRNVTLSPLYCRNQRFLSASKEILPLTQKPLIQCIWIQNTHTHTISFRSTLILSSHP
jgi:hypothetical protein